MFVSHNTYWNLLKEMSNNKLIIAAAGSGKTTLLVNESLKQDMSKVLITTYTQANEAEIRNKLIEINKYIPENVAVQTWFSFLLKHGVRPFQGVLFDKKVKGLILVNSKSGLKGYKKPCPECRQKKIIKPCSKCKEPFYFSEEKEFERHYFTRDLRIYSDQLSKFVYRCNEKTNGKVIERISRIYGHIYIDEVQDLAGYDLELLNLFCKSGLKVLLVGDPRQGTYSTNSASKNKQYKKSKIIYFFQDNTIQIDRDERSLLVNYRSNKIICDFSNKLFPDFEQTTSGNTKSTGHDGIFFIRKQDINRYLKEYYPIQLRDSKKRVVNDNYKVMNFGESKGLSFDRVLIYPTQPFIDWIKDNNKDLTETSCSKFYVAITRARYSVGIVIDNDDNIGHV
jgi:superfamily I DNA/RNA helicase